MKDRTMVAIVGLVGCTIMGLMGHNGAWVALAGMILGYYFGREKS